MNDFLKSLATFGMEGLNSEAVVVDEYASSECAEERIELDNLDNVEASMESMSDAIHETGLEAQSLALEAAGFTFENAAGFTGELSTESIANAAKRGYYEVKIQVKKAIQKIWKLIMSVFDNLVGSEGRLKSYSKLFKKYKERLGKVYPKDNKDGESREVTIRDWTNTSTNIVAQVEAFKKAADIEAIKELRSLVKAVDVKDIVNKLGDITTSLGVIALSVVSDDDLNKSQIEKLGSFTYDALVAYEKKLDDFDSKSEIKDKVSEGIDRLKDVDTKEVKIEDAKSELYALAGRLEEATKKDVKFKAELQKLSRSWDKKFGSWDLKDMADGEAKDIATVTLRILSKLGKGITGYRMILSKLYSATASNLQGVLADMAKVIAKGTNIGA